MEKWKKKESDKEGKKKSIEIKKEEKNKTDSKK